MRSGASGSATTSSLARSGSCTARLAHACVAGAVINEFELLFLDELERRACRINEPDPWAKFAAGSGEQGAAECIAFVAAIEVHPILLGKTRCLCRGDCHENMAARFVIAAVYCHRTEEGKFRDRAFPLDGLHEGHVEGYRLSLELG